MTYSNPPTHCDVCHREIKDRFYDVNFQLSGMWVNICSLCFMANGCKLGTGYGQEYRKQGAEYVKVAG